MHKIVHVITNRNNHLIALCDDGTLWIRNPYYRIYEQGWRQIEPIPDTSNETFDMDGIDHTIGDETCCRTGLRCRCGGVIHYQPVYGGYEMECDGCHTKDERNWQ